MTKVFVYDCLGDTFEFAESLGWKGDDGADDGRCDYVDALEEDALDYIRSKGYEVII